mmetsp:Transcript_36376/g.65081  ORF Transcript_36376/g.65081 Transcript_36376/m.65081 type:complete len:512 (-) Transcript_36376:403-1938(-)
MPSSDVLSLFGLSHNPFTDRTAEKTDLNDVSLYIHSDLAGFKPSDTTYVFFGKRGSGKTTIRLQMQAKYDAYNAEAAASGRSRGHYMVDLSRPGHLTACLRTYQERIGRSMESWDADFSERWTTADLVDCILSYAATDLLLKLKHQSSAQGREMLETLRLSEKATKQFLILAHLYAKTDTATLAWLRKALMPPTYTPLQIAAGAGVATTLAAGLIAAASDPKTSANLSAAAGRAWGEAVRVFPPVGAYPRLLGSVMGALTLGVASSYNSFCTKRSLKRATAMQGEVRVVKQSPTEVFAGLLDGITSTQDTADSIQLMYVGVSAHQKLELLRELVMLLGYESVCMFGDCFDEVTLLDPVLYPAAIKVFAREVCRNDLLNFGRLHFFFPDSRLALDLNTDRTLKEARFDRHFVRDLTWSRHQLEGLAERRFRSAQHAKLANGEAAGADPVAFADLFKYVKAEEFSGYLSKISTPRELMIMMTEMLARIESHPDGTLSAQDMEMACQKALEQAV